MLSCHSVCRWTLISLVCVLPWSMQTESVHGQDAPKKPTANKPAFAGVDDDPATYEVPITVSGRALNQAGQPIAGAQIFLAAQRPGYRRLAETTTDATGRYQFVDVPLQVQKSKRNDGNETGIFEVFGWAEGFALAWRPSKTFYPTAKQLPQFADEYDPPRAFLATDEIELDLQFVKPVVVKGRILDDSGQPIPDAKIAWRYADVEWDAENYSSYTFKGALNSLNERETVPPGIKDRSTDAEGWFQFENVPPDHRLRFDVRPPGFSSRFITVVTHPGITGDKHGNRVYSGDIELTFQRLKEIPFQILLGESDEPAPDVLVSLMHSDGSNSGITDNAGRVAIRVPPSQLRVELLPKTRTPYLVTKTTIEVPPDPREPMVLRVQPAAVVNITVVDDETGEPLPNVDLWVGKEDFRGGKRRLNDPPSLSRELHMFRSYERETRIAHVHRPRTDDAGKMTALFEPGSHHIGVGLETYPVGYSAIRLQGIPIEVKTDKPLNVELRMKK